ncbi:hypothetical protein Taro_017006 [Colocasia esculenta]|uniref:Acyl-[acyl-carrier-protein]--UDP-N-acetylglucosamine O-acyltransferase, mitochondrial n=1 Tax=Colocasia esculenta TaxID=4460 RepID=A0A843UQ23_COLES|nr:hypothetical protein [Colocasia esculenta]
MAALLGVPRAGSVARGFGSSLGILGRRLCGVSSYAWDAKRVEAARQTRSGLVHPTAVVHPGAVVGQGVSIGPFCTIGSSAKLGNGCQMHPGSHIFGDTELGENCILLAYVFIYDSVPHIDFCSCFTWLNLKLLGSGAIVGADLPGHAIIGRDNIIGHHAVVGVKCQDMKYKTGDECFLHVGDNNHIREYTSIHRSSKSSDKTVCKTCCGRSMRRAYRKIFMPTEGSLESIEDRLSEVEQNEELINIPAVCSMVKSIQDSFQSGRRGICKFRNCLTHG